MAKEKVSCFLSNSRGEIKELVKFFECIEGIEFAFNLEFAGGVEEGVPKFLSVAQANGTEDDYLEKYDGEVIEYFVRLENGTVLDTRKKPCRLDFAYNENYRHEGAEMITNMKIVTRGIKG